MKPLESYIFPKEITHFFSDLDLAPSSHKRAMAQFRARWKKEDTTSKSFVWILSKSELPWLQLAINPPWKEMLAEAKRVRPLYVAHRGDPGEKQYAANGWKALCIHGIDSEKTLSSNAYGYRSEEETPYRWTEIAKLCPVTTAYFKKSYPCSKYYRIRFSLLEPGGYILPHNDRPIKALWEVNFALNHPKGCYFRMKGVGYVPQRPQSAFILDVSPVHAVINTSSEDRFHIIVHGKPIQDPRYGEMILKSYRSALGFGR